MPPRAAHKILLLLTFVCFLAVPPIQPAEAPSASSAAILAFAQFANGQRLHLIAYGDTRFANPAETSGTNPRVRAWLAQRIAAEHPQAILLTGDTPFHGALQADWDEFRSETAPWREARAVELPAIGNHEVYGGREEGIANYLKSFPDIQGHRYYAAMLGNVEVISLDCTQSVGPASPQARWFAARLEHVSAQADFLLIMYHLPWVADRQSQILVNLPTSDALALRRMLEARLPRIHARVLVLNGHIHNYERFERKGVMYVVTGGGGAEPYPLLFRGAGDLYRDLGFPVYHFLTLDVNGTRLRAEMWKVKDPSAAKLEVEKKDDFTIEAPPPLPGKGQTTPSGKSGRQATHP